MPPKKKRRVRKNITSDTDSGGPSETDVRTARDRPRKAAGLGPAVQSSAGQIKGFAAQQGLARHAKSLGLKRLMLANLQQQSDMDKAYIGGQVVGHCSLPLSQGHDLSVFVQDESVAQGSQAKHLRVTIREELAEKMPVLRDDMKLFVCRAVVHSETLSGGFSQDHGKCLVLEGPEAEAWIVHRDVHKPGFFSDTSCGKKWWVKSKEKRDTVQSVLSLKSSVESSKAQPTASERDAPGPPQETRRTNSPEKADVDHQPDSQSSQFPDNPDFPDSAFNCEQSSSELTESSPSEDSSDDEAWAVKRRKPPGKDRGYTYTKLAELNVGEKKVNIIAVVKEFKPPASTRGSDYYSTLTLVDETDPRVGVKCIMFNSAPEKLPQIKRVGDIVCLHRTTISSYSCQTQVQGHRYTSAMRFSGDTRKKVLASTASVSYTCTHWEKERVRELKKWAREMRRKDCVCSLEAVTPDMYFDLVCQVVSVTISKVPRCAVLTVWDATPHSITSKVPRLEKRYEEGYPIVKDDEELADKSEGYTTYVVIYSKKCVREASKLHPGQFVYLQSLHSAVSPSEKRGEVEIRMQEETRIIYDTSPGQIEVLEKRDELRTALEKRIAERMALTVTHTPHQDQQLCTISGITGYAQPLPAKFRCKVKVLRMSTPSLEDMVIARCGVCHHTEMVTRNSEMDSQGESRTPCPSCARLGATSSSPSHLSCEYFFRIIVGDSTGSLEVIVSHEEALQLFNGLRPNNLYQHQELRYQILEKLHALTGGNAPFEGGGGGRGISTKPRPWLECCILTVKQDESIYHCLFDTSLKYY